MVCFRVINLNLSAVAQFKALFMCVSTLIYINKVSEMAFMYLRSIVNDRVRSLGGICQPKSDFMYIEVDLYVDNLRTTFSAQLVKLSRRQMEKYHDCDCYLAICGF